MLELQNIHKYYQMGTVDELRLFQNFNLEIREGQFISIVGSNGSGKTSLLNLICGSLMPEAGKILYNGHDMVKDAEHRRYRKFGRVFQDPGKGTAPSLTLAENLALAENKAGRYDLRRSLRQSGRMVYRERLRELGLGLEEKLDHQVGSLSGGQRQAVALLMATMTPIDLLILDEHTAALDPRAADMVMKLTERMVEEKGLTALMVTHNLRYAVHYGNRLIMMHEGHILLDLLGEAKEKAQISDLLRLFDSISIEYGN